jgi:hypothetical protein
MIGLRVTGKRFYYAMGFAGIVYEPAGDNSPRIAGEDYGEHDRGRIGGSALVVVMERGVEGTQIKVIDGAGAELLLKRNGKEQSLGSIKVFIPSHSSPSIP